MKMIKYPKTKQFSDVVRDIRHKATFVGLDENGDVIYDNTREKPTIDFVGTVKLHGTNAAVCYDGENLWVQSRNNVIDSLTGHQGFAEFVHANRDFIISLFDRIDIGEGEVACMYGEWVGPGIQRGVAISELPNKMWFIFGIKIRDESEEGRWLQYFNIPRGNDRIWSVYDGPVWSIPIDFERPHLSTQQLTNITEEVEKECPIAQQFGISGIGEGVVWVGWYKGERHIFKVKGDKHSSSKVKKLAQVDPEKMKSIYDFVDYAATENRVDQAMYEVSDGSPNNLTKRNTPDVLRWIANDIISEESAVMQESNIEWKDVAKEVSDRARKIFFDKLDKVL